jgi:hypothetical protein
MFIQKEYHRDFKVESIKVIEKESGPFYLTINETNQLIGDEARCLQGYFKEGMRIRAKGYDRENDFIILDMQILDPVKVGAKLNTYA